MKNAQKYGKKADLALGVWVKLARAAATFGKISAANIRTFGLTEPQFAVIECLGHLGPLRLTELSRKMLVTGGNITCVVNNLWKDDLVEKTKSPKDRRETIVRLTGEGEILFNAVFQKHVDFITVAMGVLNEKEQNLLAELLKKLGRSLIPFTNKVY